MLKKNKDRSIYPVANEFQSVVAFKTQFPFCSAEHKTNSYCSLQQPHDNHTTTPKKTNRKMAAELVQWDNLDLPAVIYKEPVRNTSGGMNGYLDTSAKVKRNPRFQLPLMRAPFGVSDLSPQATEFSRRNLELSLDDDTPVIGFLKQWDDQTLTEAAKNSKKWFGKELTVEMLAATVYRHSAQESKSNPDKYPPLYRLKVADSGKKLTKVFVVTTNSDGTETYEGGTLDSITENSKVLAICEIAGLWFASKGFGTTFFAESLLVYPAPKKSDFDFIFPDGSGPAPSETGGEGEEGERPTKRARTEDDSNGGDNEFQ